MSEKTIYKILTESGMTPEGACGMLGNMMAESSLKANIAQRGMTKLTDEEYTAKFDRAPETCYRDGIGFGYFQYTFWSRKKGLWEEAQRLGGSVGDEEVQLSYALRELKTEFSGLWDFLCKTDDLYAATDRICREFERPAVNNVDRRYTFAEDFYSRLAQKPEPKKAEFPPDPSIAVLQMVLTYNGYQTEITGYKSTQFLKTLRQFVTDIGG